MKFIDPNSNHNDLNKQSEFVSMRSVPYVDKQAPDIKVKGIPPVLRLYPSVWLALSAMSLVGMVAVGLHFKLNKDGPAVNTLALPLADDEQTVSDNTEVITDVNATEPKTQSAQNAQGVFANDINLIASNCARLVSNKSSFAVFEHGTCVLLIEPVEDHVNSAKSSLKILADPNVSFEVQALDNNNYLVVFDKYLFCWMYADQIAKSKQVIMQDKRLGRHESDSPKIQVMSDLEVRVGKLARLCLVEDSKKLNIKKIIRARRSEQENKINLKEADVVPEKENQSSLKSLVPGNDSFIQH